MRRRPQIPGESVVCVTLRLLLSSGSIRPSSWHSALEESKKEGFVNRTVNLVRLGFGLALVGLAGCSPGAVPSSPLAAANTSPAMSSASTSASGAASIASRTSDKVSLCHATGQGAYQLLSVAAPAESAHLGHGDGQIGDPYPGQRGYIFGPTCEPVRDQCSSGGSSGASSGASSSGC